ncbi:lysozyme inhibitor LprI family protein [Rhizobium miluonense]|uniref:Lysozyme inhibitor LprI N-terminal domain-containing protein n=1 Tax=Rhizobium miluonense TaxID=411945 RepID=A0A1C3UET9_9HYPH|nr:hypothetical protein [Rhizobium miluonense]SCB13867.1 hypothetical protein GA0061102_1003104 [Rhizobium miluonense]
MTISKIALTMLIGNLFALQAVAAGIDCKKPSSTSDHLICADQSLRARDAMTSDLYAAALKTDDASKIKQRQQRWVKSLQSCQDAACVRQAYDDQIGYLLTTKGGRSVSTNFTAENANGNEGNLSIFGPVDGLAAVSVASTFVGPGGVDAGDVNADGVSGVIPLKDGHGKLSADNCSIGFDRLNAQTWRVSQTGACQFADGVTMQGTYRRE